MKKLILTSPAFTGEITIIYAADNNLMLIDLEHAELKQAQIAFTKTHTPVVYENEKQFSACFGSDQLVVVESKYQVTFEMFWERYNKKHNKDRCQKLWDKLSQTDQIRAYTKHFSYIQHLSANAWKTKADPDTYLRNRYWQNDWK